MDKNGIELAEITGQGYFPVQTTCAVNGVGLNEIPEELIYERILEKQKNIQENKHKLFWLEGLN